jgi:hypothetical protein
MRRLLALFSVLVTAAGALVVGVGTAVASPTPGGCAAFGASMGQTAPWSGQNLRPLGQVVRQLTPFNEGALADYKNLCA